MKQDSIRIYTAKLRIGLQGLTGVSIA